LLNNPSLYKTPIVRNGKQATVGYEPDIWNVWD
jgi:arsenate reductase (glutaredoxin)